MGVFLQYQLNFTNRTPVLPCESVSFEANLAKKCWSLCSSFRSWQARILLFRLALCSSILHVKPPTALLRCSTPFASLTKSRSGKAKPITWMLLTRLMLCTIRERLLSIMEYGSLFLCVSCLTLINSLWLHIPTFLWDFPLPRSKAARWECPQSDLVRNRPSVISSQTISPWLRFDFIVNSRTWVSARAGSANQHDHIFFVPNWINHNEHHHRSVCQNCAGEFGGAVWGVFFKFWAKNNTQVSGTLNGQARDSGTILFGDLTTNRLQSTTFSNIYR